MMERIHLIGPSDLERLSVSHIHMALPEFMGGRDYRSFFLEVGEREIVMVLLPYTKKAEAIECVAHGIGATQIWLGYGNPFSGRPATHLLERLSQGFGVTVILDKRPKWMLEQYQFLLEISEINIAIPCIPSDEGHGWGRFQFIFDAVRKKIWNPRRRHYLFELENPAELAAYSNVFTSAIASSIVGFVSRRCYIDSRYGIPYSGSWGLLCKPVPDCDLIEGYTNSQQVSIFMANDEMIQSYGHGVLGNEFSEEFERRTEV